VEDAFHDEGGEFVKPACWVVPLFLLLAFTSSCGGSSPPPARPAATRPTVVFPDGWAVKVKLALTPEEQAQGLMYVKELPADRGMLFLFPDDAQRPFWMKNCFISLDMIWLDANNVVVDITSDAPPCTQDPCPNYMPNRPARNVLEVRGGLCAAHHVEVGDRLLFVGVPKPPSGPEGT
jgi:uncharacterized membrane protein (UPF0127 family)